MTDTLTRLRRRSVTDLGWRTGTSLEDRVARLLSSYGLGPTFIVQQHAVGRYHLDFSVPALKIALEADGWYHDAPEAAVRDRRRDATLRAAGWLVFRVDDTDDGTLAEEVARVAEIINGHLDHYGLRRKLEYAHAVEVKRTEREARKRRTREERWQAAVTYDPHPDTAADGAS